jgi:hypothetical protein
LGLEKLDPTKSATTLLENNGPLTSQSGGSGLILWVDSVFYWGNLDLIPLGLRIHLDKF